MVSGERPDAGWPFSSGPTCAPAADLAPQSAEIQRQILSLSSRDFQLWSITLLLLVVLLAGFAALVAPNLVWRPVLIHVESRYLPQLFFGLISLTLLFNIYVIAQKRELNSTRKALIQELIFNERLQGLSLIDPLTQLLNRRALEQMLSKEVTRANRMGSSLTLLMIDLDDFKSVNTRFGHLVGDRLLTEAANLLRMTFRGSDLVFRYGGDEFLVVMPETTEEQADRAVERLAAELQRWNLEKKLQCDLSMSWGVAAHVSGATITDMLQRANRKMFMRKHKMVPVF